MSSTILTLKRFGHKGQFVKYPLKWARRMAHTGKRRYDTNCDLLIGICACGDRHTGEENWIEEMLIQYNACIEPHADWLARTRKETAEKCNRVAEAV